MNSPGFARAWRAQKKYRRGWWLFWGPTLAVLFCIYRIARFVPQPLDSPNTLRPILNSWYVAALRLCPTPESAFAGWRAACLVLMLVPPLLALLHFFNRAGPKARSQGLFFGSVALSLTVARYPSLLDYQLNPDEAEFLSAAQKLFYDGNFFHAVDCGTSGPGNIYPLMLPAVFGISPDFASSRIIALLIALVVIYLLYRTVRLVAPDTMARIASLPAFAAFVSLQHANLVHYSSEQIPLLLIALALYISVRILRDPINNRLAGFLLGMLTSIAFFSKMQSVPVIAALAAVAIAYSSLYGKWGRYSHPGLLYLAGILPLVVLNLALCAAAGVLGDFWMSYIVTNHRYANEQGAFFREIPGFLGYLTGTDEIRMFLVSCCGVALVYASERMSYGTPDKWKLGTDPVRWLGLLSGAALTASVFSIYKPHRYFPHYLLFLIAPVSFVLGWMLVRQTRHAGRTILPAFFVIFTMAEQSYLWTSQSQYRFRNVLPTIRTPEGDLIRSLTGVKGKVFVWGWTADPYLSSGRAAATRDLNLFYLFLAPPEITSYYRARFLHEIRQNPPEMFVDAVGPTSWFTIDSQTYGYEQLPEVQWFVAANYIFLGHAYGQRFYLRQDLAAKRTALFTPKRCASEAVLCLDRQQRVNGLDAALVTSVPLLPEVTLPEHALIEAEFTPMARQTERAMVFGHADALKDFRGVRFENAGQDDYRLLVGLGDRWATSKPIHCPAGRTASLTVELDDTQIKVRVNRATVETITLPTEMADFTGPLTVSGRNDGERQFTGTVSFFQVVDLAKQVP